LEVKTSSVFLADAGSLFLNSTWRIVGLRIRERWAEGLLIGKFTGVGALQPGTRRARQGTVGG
jgi:hypothetical protein